MITEKSKQLIKLEATVPSAKIYVVGGFVRDTLLNREAKDKDYVVVGATPKEMISAGFIMPSRAGFPVFLDDAGEEYALARTERKNGVGYNGFDVIYDPTVTLEEDLLRRDLTINSMAMDSDGNIIDPYNGQKDLNDRILRHTSEAFAEDPVRVLRAARFSARYGFAIDNSTLQLMRKIAHELNHVPRERIWAEFEKGLSERFPFSMMSVLMHAGVFNVDCMLPYAHWHKYAECINVASTVDVRFALISAGFTDEDYLEMRIPTSAVLHSTLLHRGAVRKLEEYFFLSIEEKLAFMEQLRAFSSSDKIDALCSVAEPFLPACNKYHSLGYALPLLLEDIETLRDSVDTQAIALNCKSGKEIASAIRAARLAVLKTT